jgi:hypothetical protein
LSNGEYNAAIRPIRQTSFKQIFQSVPLFPPRRQFRPQPAPFAHPFCIVYQPELRHLPMVVGPASCLSVAAEKLREIFAKLFAGHGRLEACSTNQRRS